MARRDGGRSAQRWQRGRCGHQYTVLAPWQAAEEVDPHRTVSVRLPSGRAMTVFFYNAPLSGGVSFDSDMTNNADLFAASYLPHHLNHAKEERGEPTVDYRGNRWRTLWASQALA